MQDQNSHVHQICASDHGPCHPSLCRYCLEEGEREMVLARGEIELILPNPKDLLVFSDDQLLVCIQSRIPKHECWSLEHWHVLALERSSRENTSESTLIPTRIKVSRFGVLPITKKRGLPSKLEMDMPVHSLH